MNCNDHCNHGSLTEGKDTIQLTSLYYYLSYISCFYKHYLLFYKSSYLNEEVNRTEPSFQLVFSAVINY